MKVRIGKLEADLKEVADAVPREGFTLISISTAHLFALARLPMHHRDPFDPLLVAQAIEEDVTFISADRNAGRYPVPIVASADGLLSSDTGSS